MVAAGPDNLSRTAPHPAPQAISLTRTRVLLSTVLSFLLVTCHSETPPAPAAESPHSPAVREALAELAKGHSEKIQLAWYARAFRRTDPAVAAFLADMGVQQRRLAADLMAWARHTNADIRFAHTTDLSGEARRIMEAAQSRAVRNDSHEEFQRDILMLMWTDYAWQRSLIQATLKRTADPALRAYLTRSLAVHDAGVTRLRALLARYRWQPEA